jgi:hypothetical protein
VAKSELSISKSLPFDIRDKFGKRNSALCMLGEFLTVV